LSVGSLPTLSPYFFFQAIKNPGNDRHGPLVLLHHQSRSSASSPDHGRVRRWRSLIVVRRHEKPVVRFVGSRHAPLQVRRGGLFIARNSKNLFCDKDKLIRLQKNAIGYNLYVAAHKAQKSCPFHVSKTAG